LTRRSAAAWRKFRRSRRVGPFMRAAFSMSG
jgi:hypothetical protein